MLSNKLCVIADSWLNIKRLAPNLVKDELVIYPHNSDNIPVENLSTGSLTWDRLLKDETTIKRWAQAYPAVTLLHIGGVELATGQLLEGAEDTPIGRYVSETIENNIVALNSKAKSYQEKDLSELWEKKRVIVLVAIPNWQTFKGHSNSLPSDQVKILRRKINHQLTRLSVTLWKVHKTILVKPHLDRPRIIGVHLHHKDQWLYNNQILEVVKKVICKNCKLQDYETKKNLMNLRIKECPRQCANNKE